MAPIQIECYLCGEPQTPASRSLAGWLDATETDRSYLPMMQLRVAGRASDQCKDIYYLAMQDGQVVSRLWNGWGKHPDAVGNFGNFYTLEAFQGRGIGHQLLDAWYEDLMQQPDLPIGLFCTSANTHLLDVYGRYGFTQAVILPKYSFLYKPLDNSPECFAELCEQYYRSSPRLSIRPAEIGWRHEIDCLLKFALAAAQKPFGLPGCKSLEEAFVWPERGHAELLFAGDRPVGWSYTPANGQKQWQIHPAFQKQFTEAGLE